LAGGESATLFLRAPSKQQAGVNSRPAPAGGQRESATIDEIRDSYPAEWPYRLSTQPLLLEYEDGDKETHLIPFLPLLAALPPPALLASPASPSTPGSRATRGPGVGTVKEMRVRSPPPDATAYGALLRSLAARGQPERAIDVLEEVTASLVLPTHAVRAGRDRSRRATTATGRGGRRRRGEDGPSEAYDAHVHVGAERRGQEPRGGVPFLGENGASSYVMAEQAEVARDDGLVASLMRCAAAAGDASTVREIYLASRVRRIDRLRASGAGPPPPSAGTHARGGPGARPGGRPPPLTAPSTSVGCVLAAAANHVAYESRECGDDTRPPSTLLLAHAKAMEAGGLGSLPQYENLAIPGLDSVKADEETARERRLLSGGGGEEEVTRDWIEADERGLLSDGERCLTVWSACRGHGNRPVGRAAVVSQGRAAKAGSSDEPGGVCDEVALAQAFAEATGDTKVAQELFGGQGDGSDGEDGDEDERLTSYSLYVF
ncbi:hypothetical protein THAOC_31136, partial [Thalassiosira oceanica]